MNSDRKVKSHDNSDQQKNSACHTLCPTFEFCKFIVCLTDFMGLNARRNAKSSTGRPVPMPNIPGRTNRIPF